MNQQPTKPTRGSRICRRQL